MSQDHFLNLQPGTIINGRYEIVKCLGTGSMGMVYACRHRELAGHMVAMKVLFAEVARDSVAAARFRNEIVASYGVSHPNVVRAYEYFRDGDLIAFTMEYIGGGDLADRINSDDQLGIDEIVRMLCQMCSGVQAIHAAGIVHRDLKPENILLTAQGDIKITDFGIARMGTGPKLTEHGGVVGTIDYVSPEYLERGQVDARSDVYALGVLAYEMITGESPFRGQSVIETMTMRLRSDAEAPHKLRADCPPALSTIVLKAMTRDPEKRYQNADEMLYDLTILKNEVLPSFQPGKSRSSVPRVDANEIVANPGGIGMGAAAGSASSPVPGAPTRHPAPVSSTRSPSARLVVGSALRQSAAQSAGQSANQSVSQSGANRQIAPGSLQKGGAGNAGPSNKSANGRGGSDPDYSGTVQLDSMGNARTNSDSRGDSGAGKKDALSSRMNNPTRPPAGSGSQATLGNNAESSKAGFYSGHIVNSPTSSVSISSGKMSPERVKVLMQDYQRDEGGGLFRSFIEGFLILFVAFVVGVACIWVFKPDMLEGSAAGSHNDQATHSYVEHN